MPSSLMMMTAMVLMAFGQSAGAIAGDGRQGVIDRALLQIAHHPDAFQLALPSRSTAARMLQFLPRVGPAKPGDQFAVRDIVIDSDGTEHVRFDRYYNGLPMLGGDVITHSRAGQFKGATSNLKTTDRPDLRPKLDADDAIAKAKPLFPGTVTLANSNGLLLYARDGVPVLAFSIRLQGPRSDDVPVGDMTFYIDANRGSVLGMDDAVVNNTPLRPLPH